MHCDVQIRPADEVDPAQLRKLVALAERCCINLDTLRSGVTVESRLTLR
jgi:hypothetical protein